MKPHLSFRPRWRTLLNQFSICRVNEVVGFRLDVDGDGREEICLQCDRDFIAFSEQGLVSHRTETFLAPLPPGPGGEVRWVEAGERGDLRFCSGGNPTSVHGLGRRRFSLGGRRDYDDEWMWRPRCGFGKYTQEHRVVHLAVVSQRGAPVVLVVLADARVLAFDGGGAPIWSCRLVNGSLMSPVGVITPDAEQDKAGDELMMTCRLRQVNLFLGLRRWVHDPVTVLVDSGKVLDRESDVAVSHRLGAFPNHQLFAQDARGKTVSWQVHRLATSNGSPASDSPMAIARLLTDRWRAVEIFDTKPRGGLSVRAAGGPTLWELPAADFVDPVQRCSGLVTKVGGTEYLTLIVQQARQLKEYDSSVHVTQLLVMRLDGTILAREEAGLGRPLGKIDAEEIAFVADLDGDGTPVLVVLGSSGLSTWDLPTQSLTLGEPLANADLWSAHDLALPPEDLWSKDLLGIEDRHGGQEARR